MNNERMLSKLDILVSFIRNFKALLPTLIIIAFSIDKLNSKMLILIGICALVLVALNLLLSYLPWKHFKYWLEEDRIVIHKGVFKKEQKTIYYNRIHSVNVQQPLLLRIFGAASLQIETPGGRPGIPEGELRVLKHAYAIELESLLRRLKNNVIAAKKENDMSEEQDASNQPTEQTLSTHASYHQSLSDQASSEIQLDKFQFNDSNTEGSINTELLNNETEAGLTSMLSQMGAEDSEQYSYRYRLSAGQLMKAAMTSLNLGIVLVFIFGIYSFADDVLNLINPGLYDQLVDSAVKEYERVSIFATIMMILIALLAVWVLSIVLYLIKYGDYQINRKEEQISVSYGLLEKKSFIFDKNKIQAIIMAENPLRQWLGFAELKVQVITSNAVEQLIIHPFVRKNEIINVLQQLVPERIIDLREQLCAPPAKAFSTFILWRVLISLAIVAGGYFIFEWYALWLLILLPLLLGLAWIQMRSSGVWLDETRLIMRNRLLVRTTYFIERRNVITVLLKSSPTQRRKKLRTIKVQVLGSTSAYRVKSIDLDKCSEIWKWFSRHRVKGE